MSEILAQNGDSFKCINDTFNTVTFDDSSAVKVTQQALINISINFYIAYISSKWKCQLLFQNSHK